MRVSTRNGAALAGLFAVVIFTSVAVAFPPISIRTGSNTAADGYLEVQPDEYGAWASNFTGAPFGPNADRFKPAGSTLQVAAFTSGFFLFGPNNQRELLSDSTSWQNVNNGMTGAPTFASDASMGRSVITPNVASDSNGDGINDTLSSTFRVFALAGGTDLRFALQQRVTNVSPAVSFIQQNYTVTNDGTAPVTFKMVRVFDGDLLWDGNFESDSVGAGGNAGSSGRPYVYMQEPNQPGQSVTMSMDGSGAYFGGKHGVVPPNGPPPFDFGTDTEVWDAFGTPTSWQNLIAGVGYNTDGQSGPAPPGSTVQRDGFIGMDLTFTLAPGASTDFSVLHTYGQTAPVPEPASALAIAALGAMFLRRRGAWRAGDTISGKERCGAGNDPGRTLLLVAPRAS